MFDLTLTTSLTSPLAIGAPGLAPAAGDFALALADLVLPSADGPTGVPALLPGRQPVAETGNALPVAAAPTALAGDWPTLTHSDDAQASSPDSTPVPHADATAPAADVAAPDAALVALLEASGGATPTPDRPAAKLHDKRKNMPDATTAPIASDAAKLDAAAILLVAGIPAPAQPVQTLPMPAADSDLTSVTSRASGPSTAMPISVSARQLAKGSVKAAMMPTPPIGADTLGRVIANAPPTPITAAGDPAVAAAPDAADLVGPIASAPSATPSVAAPASQAAAAPEVVSLVGLIASMSLAPISAAAASVPRTTTAPAAVSVVGRIASVPAASASAAAAPGEPQVQPSPSRLPAATLSAPSTTVAQALPTVTSPLPVSIVGEPVAADTKPVPQPALAVATDAVKTPSVRALDRLIKFDVPPPQQQAARRASAVTIQSPSIPAPAQAAGMVFGFALSAGLLPSQRADAAEPSPREIALQALSAAAGSTQIAGAVVAAGHAQQSSLDMRRDDWPQTMIDHIEALRDAADATSTRITLIPDALGKVDVSIKHDGDAVNVHFAADVPQTRTMLADAQPRLAEAALVRGVRLGQATVDAGGGEAGRQQPQQQQSAHTPLPPRPASVLTTEADAAAPVSTRLA